MEKCDLEQIELPTIADVMDIDSSNPTFNFDYNQLSRSHFQELRPSEREKLEADFKRRTESLLSEIEKTAPNLKALDQYEAILEKERQVNEEFDAAKSIVQDISKKYELVKEKRCLSCK